MMEINRIGGPADPIRLEREEIRRTTSSNSTSTPSQDALNISSEARMASNIVQFTEAIKNLPDVRQDRVEQARRNLEESNHRVAEVVRLVAARLSKFVINE